jgi:hypothetical protein
MSLSIEIERIKRGPNLEKRCWLVQTGTLFGHRVISGAVDLGFRSALYG